MEYLKVSMPCYICYWSLEANLPTIAVCMEREKGGKRAKDNLLPISQVMSVLLAYGLTGSIVINPSYEPIHIQGYGRICYLVWAFMCPITLKCHLHSWV